MKELIFTNHVAEAIDSMVGKMLPDRVFVLVDSNTASFVLPRLQSESRAIGGAQVIVTPAGDENKNLQSLSAIWSRLGEGLATRGSLLVNVGGGMVTDMGGFAASAFKRGMPFINIPTTLLGAVDASVGGKTAVNFNNLKNEIGVFSDAELVVVSTTFFRTLTSSQLLDGYAEMMKHAMISSPEMTSRLLAYDITDYDPDTLLEMLRENVQVKIGYVEADACDTGARHALNFGHTFAHAFESMAFRRKSPLSHGYAVAFGMVAALILSHLELKFPSEWLQKYAAFVRENYGSFALSCKDDDEIMATMLHDKKNIGAQSPESVSFTLLRNIGDVAVNCRCSADNIKATLEIYRDMVM